MEIVGVGAQNFREAKILGISDFQNFVFLEKFFGQTFLIRLIASFILGIGTGPKERRMNPSPYLPKAAPDNEAMLALSKRRSKISLLVFPVLRISGKRYIAPFGAWHFIPGSLFSSLFNKSRRFFNSKRNFAIVFSGN